MRSRIIRSTNARFTQVAAFAFLLLVFVLVCDCNSISEATAADGPGGVSNNVKTGIRTINGNPTFYINGKPEPLSAMTAGGARDDDYRKFSEFGARYHRIWFIAREGWIGEGKYNFSLIDGAAKKALADNPNAALVIEFDFHRHVWWWLVKYKQTECSRYSNGDPDMQSFASKVWMRDSAKCIADVISHVKASDYGDRVIGYFTYDGSGEWANWSGHGGMYSDYSTPFLRGFREYMVEVCGKDTAVLRERWHDPKVDFGTIEIPSREERIRADLFAFIDPEINQRSIDFSIYVGRQVADSLIGHGRAVKEAGGKDTMYGAYFGYLMDYAETYRLQHSGHIGIERVIRSPHVDWIENIIGYGARGLNEPVALHGFGDSYTANGKICIVQDDTRTYLEPTVMDNAGRKLPDLVKSLSCLRRNVAFAATHGFSYYMYSLHGRGPNWFAGSDDIMAQSKRLRKVTEASAAAGMPTAAEIAVVADTESMIYVRHLVQSPWWETDAVMSAFMQKFTHPMGRVGAPYDMYTSGDLDKLAGYKLIIFLTQFKVDEATHAVIDKLKGDGRTLLWFYAPGFIDGKKFNLENMKRTTGITIGMDKERAQLKAATVAADWLLGGTSYGQHPKIGTIGPVFYVDDPSAVVLGKYRHNGKACLAIKKHDNWTSIYSAAPMNDASSVQILRSIAEKAGVFLYSPSAHDAITAGRKIFCVYPLESGKRVFRLPRKEGAILDVMSGEIVGRDTGRLELDLQQHISRFFFVGTEAEVTDLQQQLN